MRARINTVTVLEDKSVQAEVVYEDETTNPIREILVEQVSFPPGTINLESVAQIKRRGQTVIDNAKEAERLRGFLEGKTIALT